MSSKFISHFVSPDKQKKQVLGLQNEAVSAGINVANIIENNSIQDQHYLPGVSGCSAEILPC